MAFQRNCHHRWEISFVMRGVQHGSCRTCRYRGVGDEVMKLLGVTAGRVGFFFPVVVGVRRGEIVQALCFRRGTGWLAKRR